MGLIAGIVEFVMDILETIVFMGAMFIVVYLYILQPNQVKGTSMVPTFADRDYIFTSRITYKLKEPEKGDVVVFKSPQNPDVEYIKRIIATGGDTIEFVQCEPTDNSKCGVMVNDELLTEGYISDKTQLFAGSDLKPNEKIKIPEDHLFVMGDNRPGSLDSRVFGPIPKSSVIGVVFLRYLPAKDAGLIENPYDQKK
ncbi:MAG: signal peptidase I [Patescibacteria group bacterium]